MTRDPAPGAAGFSLLAGPAHGRAAHSVIRNGIRYRHRLHPAVGDLLNTLGPMVARGLFARLYAAGSSGPPHLIGQ